MYVGGRVNDAESVFTVIILLSLVGKNFYVLRIFPHYDWPISAPISDLIGRAELANLPFRELNVQFS